MGCSFVNKNKAMITRSYYKELGKLLYAIAKADGTINSNEIQELKRITKSELVPNENQTDAFGTTSAFYTEFEFDFYQDLDIDADLAYDSFISFVKENENYITPEMREKAYDMAINIANTFKGKNKSEKKMIDRLRKDLKLNKYIL
jgi:uncharacterized tellurite resistance protein B-like protein